MAPPPCQKDETMKRFLAVVLAVPCGLVLSLSKSAPDVEWRTDLGAATAEAAADSRPLLLVFR